MKSVGISSFFYHHHLAFSSSHAHTYTTFLRVHFLCIRHLTNFTARLLLKMLTTSNPYAQAWSQSGVSPSIFGALPVPPALPPAGSTTVYFNSLRPTILNCTVVDEKSRVLFTVYTDSKVPGYTVLKDSQGKNTALFEWLGQPKLEIREMLTKQPMGAWLPLSADRTYRSMAVRGQNYVWAPHGESICLYSRTSPPQTLARITLASGVITVQLSYEAMQRQLFESVLVATIILQSGRSID